MGFSRKRGRPKTLKVEKDYGTPQLQTKKNLGITTEPLDLCLKKKLISQDEHEAGIRLRWLYTLRFGSPNISAYSYEKISTGSFRNDDENWLKERSLEYENAMKELCKINAKRIVMNICIFHLRSSFLLPYYDGITISEANKRKKLFTTFKDGMEVLATSLGKKG
ncbi:MAG: hypothetical protein PQ612_01355 [Rickettsiales bacterium]|nr:hypothetical protein [Pseudomonadota bacterium]MDA0965436.1 hypothetical protein [Pseudomonadota bacterium]MDG4542761.1 hypothetical protein [Rickettsiales bacterium]MDG4544791.1 hypothetical protein [Rickettsiales bacterium]MDG4546913.1 hypothetical protein [Rickettsiales bacterium]